MAASSSAERPPFTGGTDPRPIGVLVVGTGRMAARHLRAWRAWNVPVVGVVGRDAVRTAAFATQWDVPWETDLDAALYRFRPRLASVCTPTPSHLDWVERLYVEGISTLVEKPLGEPSERVRMATLAARVAADPAAPVMAVAHTEAAHPALWKLAQLARRGAVGEVLEVAVLKAGADHHGDGDLGGLDEAERQRRLYDHLIHLVYHVDRVFGREPLGYAPIDMDTTPGREKMRCDILYSREGIDPYRGGGAQATGYISLDHTAPVDLLKSVAVVGTRGRLEWNLAQSGEFLRLKAEGRQSGTRIDWERMAPDMAVIRNFLRACQAHLNEGVPAAQAIARSGASGLDEGVRVCVTAWGAIQAHTAAQRQAKAVLAAMPTLPFVEVRRAMEGCLNDAHRLPFLAAVADDPLPPPEGFVDAQARTLRDLLACFRDLVRPRVEHVLYALRQVAEHGRFDPDDIAHGVYSGAFTAIHLLRFDNKCNQACLFCNVMTEAHDRMSTTTTEARAIIDRAILCGERRMTFTGGEPTLRPDLVHVIRYARRRGAGGLDMQSNAIKSSRIELAWQLKDAGLETAMISLHSHRADLSDYLTRRPGTFARTVAGIHNLCAVGLTVRLNHVLTTANYRFLNEYLQFVAANFPKVRDIDVMLDQHTGGGLNFPFLVPKLSDIKPVLAEAFPLAERLGLRLNSALTIPPCAFGDRPEQTLEFHRMKALKALGRENDTFTQFHMKEKRKGPDCTRCVLDPYCHGVWHGYADRHGFDGVEPLTDPALLTRPVPDFNPHRVTTAPTVSAPDEAMSTPASGLVRSPPIGALASASPPPTHSP